MADCTPTPEVVAILKDMAKALVEAGHDNPRDVVDRIHAEIQDHTPMTIREIADVVSEAMPGRKRTASEITIRMNKLKKDLRDTFHPKDKNETANKTRQTQLKKDIEKLQKQLDTKDFSKPERTKPVYNEETQKLEKERAQKQREVDRIVTKLKYDNQSKTAKVVDTAFSLRRAFILSGMHTLAKLTSAALSRIVLTTPAEEAIGSGLRHLPYISGIAAKAPREGHGFGGGAEWEAVKKTFSKETLTEMKDTLLTASGQLDAMYGKDKLGMHKWLDLVGQAHGALKTPAKRNEFYRSVVIRTQHARQELIAQGKTPAEVEEILGSAPGQAIIAANAYKDSKRAIFMSDNQAVTAYKALIGVMKNQKEGSSSAFFGGVGARTLEYLLPIVKVPTNVVAEAGSYSLGAVKAIVQLAAAGGKEKLTPDQADYIMRALKKQTLGAALMAVGYLVPSAVGGYYRGKSAYKDEDEPAEGSLKLFGHEVPKVLLHTPAFEMLQMGATVRKVMDAHTDKLAAAEKAAQEATAWRSNATNPKDIAKADKKVEKTKIDLDKLREQNAAVSGVYEGAAGLLGQVPFFDTPKRLTSVLKSPESVEKYLSGEAASAIVPAAVNDVAKAFDPEQTPRRATTLGDALKLRIPYLRNQVEPAKFNKVTGATAKLELFLKSNREEQDQYYEPLIKSIKHSSSLTQEQKDNYIDRADEAYNKEQQ